MEKQKLWGFGEIFYITIMLAVSMVLSFMIPNNSEYSRSILLVLMFLPGLAAFVFKILGKESVIQPFKGAFRDENSNAYVFSFAYPMIFVAACALLAVTTGLGTLNTEKLFNFNRFINLVINMILTLLPALGEEYGWRGYLLPKLTSHMSKLRAAIILSIVWVFYHIPVIYVFLKLNNFDKIPLLVIIQGCALLTLSFVFTYCYYISKSIVPVTVLHSVWNSFNTWMLGDIFLHKATIIRGNVFLINGEGLLGFVLGAAMIAFYVYMLKKALRNAQPK